jgi:glutathione S-transferase
MADAMYAPVVTRLRTYHVEVDAVSEPNCREIMAMPGMIEWIEAAKREPREIDELEAGF